MTPLNEFLGKLHNNVQNAESLRAAKKLVARAVSVAKTERDDQFLSDQLTIILQDASTKSAKMLAGNLRTIALTFDVDLQPAEIEPEVGPPPRRAFVDLAGNTSPNVSIEQGNQLSEDDPEPAEETQEDPSMDELPTIDVPAPSFNPDLPDDEPVPRDEDEDLTWGTAFGGRISDVDDLFAASTEPLEYVPGKEDRASNNPIVRLQVGGTLLILLVAAIWLLVVNIEKRALDASPAELAASSLHEATGDAQVDESMEAYKERKQREVRAKVKSKLGVQPTPEEKAAAHAAALEKREAEQLAKIEQKETATRLAATEAQEAAEAAEQKAAETAKHEAALVAEAAAKPQPAAPLVDAAMCATASFHGTSAYITIRDPGPNYGSIWIIDGVEMADNGTCVLTKNAEPVPRACFSANRPETGCPAHEVFVSAG